MPDHVVVVDEGTDIVEELLAEGVGFLIEHADIDGQLMLEQEFGDGLHRELQHLILGKAVHPRADEGKGHRLAVVLHGQFKGLDVAGAEDIALSVGTAIPHGAGGVDDVLTGEVVPARDLGLPEAEGGNAGALGVQLFPCHGMYGEIHAAVADHFFVGGVDDGVNGEVGYVLADDLEGHVFAFFLYGWISAGFFRGEVWAMRLL